MDLSRLIRVARGDAEADVVFVNARIVNTFTGEIEEGNVAVAEGRVAGIGDYTEARETVDVAGRYLAPGLIDGHFHLESTYLHVDQFARAVVPRGTLAAVTDLHEVTNVAGLEGMRYIMECGRRIPMDLFFMAPSCVPATDMETSGATLGPEDIRRALRWKGVLGLGELMNFPGVIGGDEHVLDKVRAAHGRPRDGHAPHVRGKALNAYLSPIIGSDHESTEYDEGLEKLRRGMRLMIREGSSEKNLEELLPLVNDGNYHRCMLVVDDRSALDVLREGDVDAVVRKAIRLGLDPVRAIQMATLNVAEYFRLEGLGGIAPGYYANMLVLRDLDTLDIAEAYYRGELVARDGQAMFRSSLPSNEWIKRTVNVREFDVESLSLAAGTSETFPVIEIVPGQIVTRRRDERPSRSNGSIVADPDRDLLKLVVVERHKATGNIGVGLVGGFGLRRGALATSVAHDSHNIVVVGVDDSDIYAAVKEVERNQGGLCVVAGGEVLASLPLPIAGLLSPEPLEMVAAKLEELERLARELGCSVNSPFSVLSFLALPVIPELKLTDMGLVDVMAGRLLERV
ncbi:MAG: adenine deaminase [Chloroflexota bacterium]|nr:adenine deaminase [Chloroflexota bacterium]MDE2941750.1 adenine deaminase [Chloroflexota bacterium]MDE3268475.1 adenine deaminase [Chloroflexota bacterium]